MSDPAAAARGQLDRLAASLRQRLDSERRFGLDLLPRPPAPLSQADRLERLRCEAEACELCELCRSRHKLVFGDGSAQAELMFIGEAPGADEDAQGVPFVGRAGQKLTEIIEKGMKIPRSSVYIANILKCRPPGNRTPSPAEMAVCKPHLLKQIEIIRPKVIIALGSVALNGLLGAGHSITRLRGLFQDFHGIPLMPTFHPSYVLRKYTREVRQQVWDDMRKVLAKLAEIHGQGT